MAELEFVHLHTHSEYSLLDGAARLTAMAQRAAELGQKAIALTDHGVLSGALEFHRAAVAAGVRPIIGCEVYVAARSRLQREGRADRDPSHLILLARDDTGYHNLMKVVSEAHLEGFYYKPRIDRELLAAHHEGLVALSGCVGGEIPQRILAGDTKGAEALCREYSEILGPDGFFLELQNHGMEEEAAVRQGLLAIARATGLPLVATNDSHYVHPDDAVAHDVLLCIQTGSRVEDPKRLRFAGPHFYLTSAEEMAAKFPDCLEAVANSARVAERCAFEPVLHQPLLPRYDTGPELDSDAFLRQVAERGLAARVGEPVPAEYRERLDYELGVIAKTGFAAYFLIVWDFTRAGREEGVKIGPGRGSAAGSLVSYSLGITSLDPLRYGLTFERFLNLERVSMPDIDIDFDVTGRGRVIDYVTRKYGSDRVAQIITFGTMAARAAIRDVGRVQGVPLPDVDRLAKLIPLRPGMTLEAALEDSRELRAIYEGEGWAAKLIDTARRLEGIARNAGTHAGGVVIGPGPLVDYVPLQRGTTNRESVVTQFDMNGVQELGLLKMDFLGLENLTVLEETLDHVERSTGTRPDLDSLPLDDPPTYDLLTRGDTIGVFQLEGEGGRRVLMDMRPRSIEDLAAANALNRPGPIEGGVIDMYMRRRRGDEPITYMLPALEPILRETHGVILYQDQVMQIASAVAGFSLGEADLLRAAMGKKDKAKMAAQRDRFVAGAVANGVEESLAGALFDYIDRFAGYGFNKAHAVAYGLIGFQTAYFKANHPLEYMCALLNSRAGDLDRVKRVILDARARQIEVLPPDVNRSQPAFSIWRGEQSGAGEGRDAGVIVYGLQQVKNVGEGAARAVVAARDDGGPFSSLLDLCRRVRGRDLNRRVLEALIRAGACDALGDRGWLLLELDGAMREAERSARDVEAGQISLFDDGVAEAAEAVRPSRGPLSQEEERERLAWERELLGMYLSRHPLSQLGDRLRDCTDADLDELARLSGKVVQVGGALRECRRVQSRKGEPMAFGVLEDLTGTCELIVFPKVFAAAEALLHPDAVVVVRGRVEVGSSARLPSQRSEPGEDEAEEDSEAARLIAESVLAVDAPSLAGWRPDALLHLTLREPTEDMMAALAELLADTPGPTPVVLHLLDGGEVHELELGEGHRVEASAQLGERIEALLGPGCFRVERRHSEAPAPRPRGPERAAAS